MYSSNAVCCPTPEKASQMQLIAENDNGRTVDIRLGESVRINLPENATTGYSWTIERYDEDVIDVLASEPCYPTNAIGSGGTMTFILRSKKIGTGDIVLKHWRHWEGDASVISRFRIQLHVRP